MGLIGGMSWESTVLYYQLVNRLVAERLGPLHSAQLVMYSVDFHDIEVMQRTGQWTRAGEVLADAARAVEAAGADFLVMCTNTMHKVADAVTAATSIPLLHIVDPTAQAIREQGLRRVGLLATRFTMEEPFYRDRLAQRFGIEAIVPEPRERERVHAIIYDELCQGRVLDSSRAEYVAAIEGLRERGAEGVILGCTEITLLISAADSPLPVFDSTALHARAAVEWALLGASTHSR
jgi:aspartate racemase